ncbi:hypothetical protein JAAARDRAFT_62739 [Jaapia argillacea MUCL 33604]|uniref:Uncharacterized protein n=1 Tax=Jaapia argillacea MUCL 33604 TaxID=933084 RepID=A0A067P8R4_9AGAM|nr:hypothetical protein JAAARDRAFT_62739 [Jaapia argillacea MUCL 33604]
MQAHQHISTESLASGRDSDIDTRTIVSPASIFSLDESETATLRAPSLSSGSLFSKSQETIVPKKARRGMMGIIQCVLTPFNKSDSTNDKLSDPCNPLTEISRLLKRYKISTISGHRAKAKKLSSTILYISTQLDYECIEAITRLPYPYLPKFAGISVCIHEPYTNKLKTLTDFVERMSALGAVFLTFCLRHDERRNKVERWKEGENEALVGFLGALEGKDCGLLVIDEHRGIWLCRSQHPDGPQFEVSEPSHANPEKLPSPPPLPSSYSVPVLPSPLSTLTILEISHPLMFASPWLTYLTQTINSSPLVSLSLRSDNLPFQDWSSLLHNISVPSLQSLCISGQLQRVDFMEFRERHKTVRMWGYVRDGERFVHFKDGVWPWSVSRRDVTPIRVGVSR